MNLKEAFRYQNFLDKMMGASLNALNTTRNAVNVTLNHKKQAANADAKDQTETIDKGDYPKPEVVMTLMGRLVTEKETLTRAISAAKNDLRGRENGIDIDATMDVVKLMRQQAAGLEALLRNKPATTKETGTDYKFNNEGNQVPYSYEIEKTVSLDFDAAKAKATLRKVLRDADALSARLESAYVNGTVTYAPPFDVNDTFEDLLTIIGNSTAADANTDTASAE